MIYAIVLTIIVAVLLGTAVFRSLTVKSQADFLVAGRKLTWPVLVFTLLSSWIGAGSLFAGGENAYLNGFSALWQPAGGWVGLVVIAAIAGRARRFAQFTVPDLTRNPLQHRRARAGHHRHRHLLHRDHQLPIQRRRRHSAPDLSLARSEDRHEYHRGVRDHVHGAGGHGVGRLSRPDHRLAGDRHCVDLAADGADAHRRMGRQCTPRCPPITSPSSDRSAGSTASAICCRRCCC